MGSQTSQARVERQEGRGGWGAEPSRAPQGSQPVGGVAHIPQPHPRQQATPISRRTCVHGMGSSRPCPAGWGERGVPQGVTEFQAWGGPAQPCMALSSWAGQAVAAGPTGTESLTHLFTACAHTRVAARSGGHAGPSPPAPKRQSLARPAFIGWGRGLLCGGGGGPPRLPLFSPANSWRDPSPRQGQRSSKSTPLAGFLLGERRG